MGRAFAVQKGLEEHAEEFAKGAMVAQDPLAFESLPMLNDEDRRVLGREVTHKVRYARSSPMTVQTLIFRVFYAVGSPQGALLPGRHVFHLRRRAGNGRVGYQRRQLVL